MSTAFNWPPYDISEASELNITTVFEDSAVYFDLISCLLFFPQNFTALFYHREILKSDDLKDTLVQNVWDKVPPTSRLPGSHSSPLQKSLLAQVAIDQKLPGNIL